MKKGFTLIELLLVLVIMAVIMAMNAPSFGKFQAGLELRQAADKVVYLFRYARSQAITRGVPFKVVIEKDSFRVYEAMDGDEETALQFKPLSGRMGRLFCLPRDVHFESPPGEVLFRPDGQLEKVKFAIAGASGRFFVSTKEIAGNVSLWEENVGP